MRLQLFFYSPTHIRLTADIRPTQPPCETFHKLPICVYYRARVVVLYGLQPITKNRP